MIFHWYIRMPRTGIVKPGVYLRIMEPTGYDYVYRHLRLIPLPSPHALNEKRDGIQMPNWLKTIGLCREPDFVVTVAGEDAPYMNRWWILPRNKWLGVNLHQFLRSDQDTLHDHPWNNVSILLKGSYMEESPCHDPTMIHPIVEGRILPGRFKTLRTAGDIVRREAAEAHRIELIEEKPVWTLFMTGPVIREWGFHCPNGWIPFRKFVATDNLGAPGRGCEQ